MTSPDPVVETLDTLTYGNLGDGRLGGSFTTLGHPALRQPVVIFPVRDEVHLVVRVEEPIRFRMEIDSPTQVISAVDRVLVQSEVVQVV